jgi:hypothetical protein
MTPWLPRTRKVRLSLAIGTAVALGTVATAVASAQTSDTVTITSVTASTTPGQLVISVTSDSNLNELNVILAPVTGSGTPVQLTLANFTQESGGTGTDGTYVSPLTMAELPDLGTYTVEVTAGDSDNGVDTDNNTSLYWLDQPNITLSASPATFSYADPSVAFSGTLSLTFPDGSADTTTPLSGLPLQLTDNLDSNTSAITTGAGGTFSATASQPASGAAYKVSFEGSLTIAVADSNSVDVSAVQDPAQVTAKASKTQLKYGQDLTISGAATYDPGQGYVGLAESPVEIFSHPYGSAGTTPFATTTANGDGGYSVTFADKGSGGPWYVYSGGLPGDPTLDELLSQASATTATVNVAYPVSISGLRASLNAFAVLTLTGCLRDSNAGKALKLPLQAEYATRRAGPWHVLGTVEGTSRKRCGSGPDFGSTFDYHVTVAVAAAYYRLAYPGGPAYQSAVSKSVYEAKTLTKITNFTISRHTVAKNGTVTVSGRLWDDTKGWHPFPGRKVFILFHYKGVWYYFPHQPVTSSSGTFSGTFKPYATAPWIAEYMGSSTYFACASARVTVRVTGARSAQLLAPSTWLARPFAGEVLTGTQAGLAG